MSNPDFYQLKTKQIHSPQGDVWTLEFYQGYENYIFKHAFKSGSQLSILDIISYVEQQQYSLSFRYNIEVKTAQFLLGVVPQSNTIYIASKNLSHELTMAGDERENISEEQLHNHAQKIATIPLENTPAEISLITHKYKLCDFNDEKFNEVHNHAYELSEQLIEKVNFYKQSWFEKISDFGLNLTANYKLIRVHLLKFLAILPSLDHDKKGDEVKRIFIESMVRLTHDSQVATQKKYKADQRGLPVQYIWIIKTALFFARIVPAKFLAWIIRYFVSLMAKRFIAGENIYLAQKSLVDLIDSNRDATLDQLGELVVSHKEADEYEQKVIEIINGFENHITAGSKNNAGINQAHVSIKVSALSNDFRPYAFEQTYEKVAPRLKRILIAAKEKQVFINIDAEHYHYRDVVLRIYSKVLLETAELKDYTETGIVVQAYLRDGICILIKS